MKPKPSLLFLLSFVFYLGAAQVPQGFNYQAIVRDGVTKQPIVSQPVLIRVTIEDGIGTDLYQEIHSLSTDEFGIISIIIGQGTPQGAAVFDEIDWNNEPLSIKTELQYPVGGSYTEMGTAPLMSVPYAMVAEDTETKQTLSIDGSELTISDGNTITIPSTGSVWQTDGTNVYRETGKVGIGTTSPAEALDVNGSIISRSLMAPLSIELNNYNTGDRSSYIDFHSDDKWTDYALRIRRYNGENAASRIEHRGTGPLQIYTAEAGPIDFYTSGSSNHRMRIGSDGNIGIGTTSSSSKFALQPSVDWDDNTPLFEVKNKYGIAVLAVYNNGVKINIEHDPDGVKGPKGGFAIGGYDYTKGGTVTLMNVTSDSIRFNINNDNTKGPKGGFAIGGFDYTKGDINEDFMYITPQVSDNGYFNVFTGYQSGYKTVSPGIANAFYGYKSGFENTTGSLNTFIGNFSGLNNTTGAYNTAVGGLAGASLYSGTSNIFIGSYAGYDSSNPTKQGTGSTNIFIGNYAGKAYTSGYDNVFVGTNSGGKTTSGNNNVALGGAALWENTGGVANVAIGASAGYKSKGNNNVFLGRSAGYYEEGSHRLYIDNFGYSAANAFIYGEFDNHFLRFNASVEINGRLDVPSVIRTTGVAVPSSGAGLELSYSGGVAYVESYDRSASTTKPLCLSGSYVYPFNQINLGSSANRWNTIYCANAVNVSDSRLKKEISDLHYGLASIMKLEPVTFMWNDQTDGDKHIGLIAQDVAEVIKEVVDIGDDEEKTLGINYSQLVPVLIKGMQEQQAQIEQLNAVVASMKEEIASLRPQ